MPDPVAPEGQEQTSANTGAGNTAAVAEPFLKIDEHTSFNSAEDAIKAFKEGTARHSEYKKNMESLAEERRRYDADRVLHAQQVKDFEEKRKGYDLYKQWDERLKTNPGLYKKMAQIMGESPKGSDIQEMIQQAIKENVDPRLAEFEAEKKRRLVEEEKGKYFAELKAQYQDFDDKAVDEAYQKLYQGSMKDLAEMLYFAGKGRTVNPVAVQEKIMEGLEKKKTAGLASPKGSTVHTAAKEKSFNSLAERLKEKAGDD